jgi:hypothetical protein
MKRRVAILAVVLVLAPVHFGQALFRFGRLSDSARFDSDNSELMTKDGFAASFGGGADFVVQKIVAVRSLLDFFPVPAKQRKLQQR